MSSDFFVSRTTYGVEAVAGNEVSALTIGFARRTRFTPPHDAVSFLHFQVRQPLAARAKVWRAISGAGAVPADLIEEINR